MKQQHRLQANTPYTALDKNIARIASLFAGYMVWGSDWPHTWFAAGALPACASNLEPVLRVLKKEQKIDALHHAPKRLSGYADGVLSGSLKSAVNPFFIWSPSCPKESESKPTSAPPSPSHPRATPPRHHTAKRLAWSAAHPPAAKRTPASVPEKAADACQLRLVHAKRLSRPLFAFCGFKSKNC